MPISDNGAFFHSIVGKPTLRWSVPSNIRWMFTDRALRRRLIITFAILLLIQLASFVTLPGLNIEELQNYFRFRSGNSANAALHANIFGRDSNRFSILLLGLMPFFGACAFLQLAGVILPPVRRWSFSGEAGREKLVLWTYVLTVFIGISQGFFYARMLERNFGASDFFFVSEPGPLFRLGIVATVVASVFLLIFAAERINRYGIGNGFALVFLSLVASRFLFSALTFIDLIRSNRIISEHAVLFILLVIALFYCIFQLTSRVQVVEVKSPQQPIPLYIRNTFLGFTPARLTLSAFGLLPLLFISFKYANVRELADFLTKNPLSRMAIFILLTALFAYLYMRIVYSRRQLVRLLKRFGYTIDTLFARQIAQALGVSILTIILLSVMVNILPLLVTGFFRIPYWIAALFISSLLLAQVGIFYDTIAHVEFFRSRAKSGIAHWAVCCIALDESEAAVKKAYLQQKDIPALVEPFRFSWGMPIRTMVDQYRIYVPEGKQKEARAFIGRA